MYMQFHHLCYRSKVNTEYPSPNFLAMHVLNKFMHVLKLYAINLLEMFDNLELCPLHKRTSFIGVVKKCK